MDRERRRVGLGRDPTCRNSHSAVTNHEHEQHESYVAQVVAKMIETSDFFRFRRDQMQLFCMYWWDHVKHLVGEGTRLVSFTVRETETNLFL